ncbi:unnamed protein product [Penicillium roqueforti FM164]|uniref:Genomic scaffold, ProqFM164S02 n=1 Tax=Penicillium roqueforti (strain FM164) TaxID=1365484 RepID=W6Q9A8_PENRF|nr:unnamed protein product [Penicillium roqueforti FM164]
MRENSRFLAVGFVGASKVENRHFNNNPQKMENAAENLTSRALTPDLRHSVKRRVIVKRVIPTQDFPISRLQSAREVFSSQQACEENTRLKSIYETNKPALLCCDMKLYIGDHVESI